MSLNKYILYGFLLFYLNFLFLKVSIGQSLDSTFEIIKSKLSLNDPSKPDLYFHTDRDIYKTGEEVWFSAHLLGSNENLDSFHTLYVLLINEIEQKVVKIEKYALDSGFAAGKLIIPDSLFTASYGLVCYTNRFLEVPGEKYHRQPIDIIGRKVPFTFSFLKQFSKDSLKYVVKVNNDNNFAPDISLNLKLYSDGVKLIDQKQKTDKYGNFALSIPSKNELQQFEILASVNYKNEHIPLRVQVPIMNDEWSVIFLNEDNLVDKQLSQLNIQLIDSAGKPVSGKCQLLENDSSILSFKTDLQGYASINLSPDAHKSYKIKYFNRVVFPKQNFPIIITKDLSLSIKQEPFDKIVQVDITSPKELDSCLIAINNRIQFIGGSLLRLKQGQNSFRLSCSEWPRGLATISIFDLNTNLKDQNDIFLAYTDKEIVKATLDSTNYGNRAKVELKIRIDSSKVDVHNSIIVVRAVHAGTIKADAINITKLNHLTYFNDENIELDQGIHLSVDNNIQGILQACSTTQQLFSFENNPDFIEKYYDGHVLKGEKPLKSPVNIYMGGKNATIVNTDSSGRFTLPIINQRIEFPGKIMLTVNFKDYLGDPDKMYGLYIDTVGKKINKWLADKYYRFTYNLSSSQKLPDEYNPANKNEKELDAVVVIAQKKVEYNEYVSEMGPGGYCNDYVCNYGYLNCMQHTTGRRPFDGEIFDAQHIHVKPFNNIKNYNVKATQDGKFVYRCKYKNMPPTMQLINGIWENENQKIPIAFDSTSFVPIKQVVLYWNSKVNLNQNKEATISFFTNDMKGDYVCDIQCISGTNIYTSTVHFVIEPKNN